MKKNLLISKCLLGENVRYDGGNCLISNDHFEIIKKKFNLIAICPEMMAGMSVPREPIELLNDKVLNSAGVDMTSSFDPIKSHIQSLIETKSIEFAIMKEDSPSCGVHHIYDGSFSGKIIEGAGLISKYLKECGVAVYSEQELEKLISHSED